ncbi:MAG: Lysophospholipase [Alphaproteobacteria bacterium]|nr:Lysophospholipase [Alphaproteobacteria bacterium]
MKMLSGLAAAFLAAAPAAAQQPAPTSAPDYADTANWLCLPGRDDACSKPLPTTALNPNGYGSTGLVKPAANPKIDCFYVYPTVSRDPGDNSDLVPGPEEQTTAWVQFARYGTICRTFAPVYRQATLTALRKAMAGAPVTRNFDMAYADVLAAWRTYLARYNQGRPFVLIGHSQGSIMIERLIAEEVEKGPAAARMLSAVIAGFNVEVPEGKLVGGTFKKTPLCSRTGETGCILTWVSFRAESPPPEASLFGRAVGPGMTIGCTNPARLGGDGAAPLDSYWYTGPSSATDQTPIAWSSEGAPPTPFLRTEGLASGACVHRGNIGYFATNVNADPKDKRTDVIPGDVVVLGQRLPGWGMHLSDMNLPMGDVIRLIEAQRDAWLRRR